MRSAGRLRRAVAIVGACLALGRTPLCDAQASAAIIPATTATALDGHPVSLPRDLRNRATVLILGFGRHSADATTAWEKPVRTRLLHTPAISFFDIAMLAELPGFARPLIIRAIRRQVPDVLKPNFLPLTDGEDAWKRAANFDSRQPEAAYVLLVDQHGEVRWQTHSPYTDEAFASLSDAARKLAAEH